MPQTKPGTWEQLNNPRTSTRVFELLSGRFEARIVLIIHLVEDFTHPIHYEAISYTWGDESASQEITVDDQPYMITQNLCTCLRHMRKPDESRMLWADAISINQEDEIEKGHQVSIIGKIFQSAVRVLAWIGDEADGSDELLKAAQAGTPSKNPSEVKRKLRSVLRLLHIQSSSNPNMVYDPKRKNYEAFAESWASLAKRPYWTRTWIVQEIVLAKDITVCCGKRQVGWQQFITWFGYISEYLWSTSPVQDALSVMVTGANRDGWQRDKWGLFFVLYNFDYVHCSNRLDKVYALLSLATPEEDKDPLTVDYTIDFVELYFRTFEYCYRPGVDRVFFDGKGLRQALGIEQGELAKGLAERPDFLKRVGCTRDELFGDDKEALSKSKVNT